MALPTKDTMIQPGVHSTLYSYQREFFDRILAKSDRGPYDVIALDLPWGEVRSFSVPPADRSNPRFQFRPRGSAPGKSIARDPKLGDSFTESVIVKVCDLEPGTKITPEKFAELQRAVAKRLDEFLGGRLN